MSIATLATPTARHIDWQRLPGVTAADLLAPSVIASEWAQGLPAYGFVLMLPLGDGRYRDLTLTQRPPAEHGTARPRLVRGCWEWVLPGDWKR
jgi:hypothetical protein